MNQIVAKSPWEHTDTGRVPLKWNRAIEALLQTPHLVSAATLAGVSVSTLNRWLHVRKFQDALQVRVRQVFSDTIQRAKTVGLDALLAMDAMVRNRNLPAELRLDAAHKLMQHVFRAHELMDVGERLAKIEEQLGVTTIPVHGVTDGVPSLLERIKTLPKENGLP
jgi:isopentenyl diphosphate isomerase/L-lactate dehydrogenase-like FMN-dependent dehydrogenase